MKLYYFNDWMEDDEVSVVLVGNFSVRVWKNGIKTYKSRHGANKYLQSIAEEKVKLAEPDEIWKCEPGETIEQLMARTIEEMSGHLGYFERIYPHDPDKCLETPKVFYKSFNTFPPSDIWYTDEKQAKKENDGMDTIYLGPVEVYDPDEVKRIEDEIASYPGF